MASSDALAVGLWPSGCVDHGDGIEVVAPVRHLAAGDGDDGDEAVVVGSAGLDRLAVNFVFQDYYRGLAVPVDPEAPPDTCSGVHTGPGATPLTRMPFFASCFARDFTKFMVAALVCA